MGNVSGVVGAVRKDSRGLMIDDVWYSSYNAFSGVARGDTVSFEFVEKGAFKNIKGAIRKEGSGGGTAPAAAGAAPKAYSRGGFPIDVKDGQRSIIRQNAVTNAREVLSMAMTKDQMEGLGKDDLTDTVINVARRIEAYTTGDLDIEIATKYLNGELTDSGLSEA